MTTHYSALRRIAAGAGVLTLALAGVATAASAEPGPGEEGAPESGTLYIHKHAGSTSGDTNDGTEQDVNRPGLEGVTFTITQIGVPDGDDCAALDLTTPGGWEDANKIADGALVGCELDSDTATTGSDGSVSTDLDVGFYLVQETDAPSIVQDRADDFYVSIPYPSGSGDDVSWLYDVHVYPKNVLDKDENETGKTVTDPEAPGLGAELTWTITTTPVGVLNQGEPLGSYSVSDTLDNRLTYIDDSLSVVLDGAAVDANFYTASTPSGSGGDIVVELTDDGLDWFNSLPAGSYLEISYTTAVTSVGEGKIDNSAHENGTDENGDPIDTPPTEGETSTVWGSVTLNKHHAGNTDQGLKGAVFSVYETDANDACVDLGEAIEVSGETEFISNADGDVFIPGLWVASNVEESDVEDVARDYCILEITPPSGYSASEEPIQITVNAGANSGAAFDVPNVAVEGPDLPLTGAQGTLAMTVGGLLLIALGAGTVVLVRKRSHAA